MRSSCFLRMTAQAAKESQRTGFCVSRKNSKFIINSAVILTNKVKLKITDESKHRESQEGSKLPRIWCRDPRGGVEGAVLQGSAGVPNSMPPWVLAKTQDLYLPCHKELHLQKTHAHCQRLQHGFCQACPPPPTPHPCAAILIWFPEA